MSEKETIKAINESVASVDIEHNSPEHEELDQIKDSLLRNESSRKVLTKLFQFVKQRRGGKKSEK